jgi:hypothetical protein
LAGSGARNPVLRSGKTVAIMEKGSRVVNSVGDAADHYQA